MKWKNILSDIILFNENKMCQNLAIKGMILLLKRGIIPFKRDNQSIGELCPTILRH